MTIRYFKRKTKQRNGFTPHLFNGVGKSKLRIRKKGAGFTVLFLAILISLIMTAITISITVLTIGEYRISRNIDYSTKAYYAAEAGIEDALLRLKKSLTLPAFFSLTSGQATAGIEVSEILGGSRTIISEGNVSDFMRRVRVVYQISTESISFYYGAQAGDGGIEMESNSMIHGNVFSNGTVKAVTGTATVDNSVIVAKSGNKVVNLMIGTPGNIPADEVRVHTCEGSTINGNLYYVSGGSSNCTVNGGFENVIPNDVDPENMAISDSQIDNWKSQAADGGVQAGDFIVNGGSTEYLGPKKILGSLIVENNATLILTGNLWIVGDITINNGGSIRLDAGYGSTNGLVVADEKILVENGAILEGSGAEGSYLMLLTTNNSILLDDPAIYVKNNAQGAIFYASNGMIRLRNNINVREATGWKLYLDNNAEITYESGLINSLFSSGPGGSWEVVGWEEIE